MQRIVLLGAGKIGAAIVDMLGATGDFDLAVGDHDPAMLDAMNPEKATLVKLDVEDGGELRGLLDGRDAVISALPYYLNTGVAEAARDTGAHYFDLTEDVETTRRVHEIASAADTRVHAAVRPRARVHLGRRPRPGAAFRRVAHGAHAGRRPAPVPDQPVELQPDLVDRRG